MSHAANNDKVKYYIDFAAEHGFDAVLVEGWNIGWEDWFVGCTVDENGYTSAISFDFLTKGKTYIATIYSDAPNAHYLDNPQAYQIRKVLVNSKSKLKQQCAPGGGYAISIMEVKAGDQAKGIKKL